MGTACAQCCDIIGLQLWPPKGADPELRHSIGLLTCKFSEAWCNALNG